MKVDHLLSSICVVEDKAKWGEVNLDKSAQSQFKVGKSKVAKPNPLIDADICEEWVKSVARSKKVDYTWGGYMEDRAHLWRGSYLQPNASVHYGIDVNVPAATLIRCPVDFQVVEMLVDDDQHGGWGGRVVVRTKRGLVVFAHLRIYPNLSIGVDHSKGFCIGCVAPSWMNGGWYPHLHLQGLDSLRQLNDLDGYGPAVASAEFNYPDPLTLLVP